MSLFGPNLPAAEFPSVRAGMVFCAFWACFAENEPETHQPISSACPPRTGEKRVKLSFPYFGLWGISQGYKRLFFPLQDEIRGLRVVVTMKQKSFQAVERRRC